MHLAHHHHPEPEEVDCLIRNAELRDEIEPYLDESISEINFRLLPTPMENRFLESMLAWERGHALSLVSLKIQRTVASSRLFAIRVDLAFEGKALIQNRLTIS